MESCSNLGAGLQIVRQETTLRERVITVLQIVTQEASCARHSVAVG